MPMHRRQGFDPSPLSVAASDYSSMLRGVFRQAVGYALASALATVAPRPLRSLEDIALDNAADRRVVLRAAR